MSHVNGDFDPWLGGKEELRYLKELNKFRGIDKVPLIILSMEKTDRDKLCSKYEGIPECITTAEIELFKQRLADSLAKIVVSENNDDPEHNFLIGLAYLDGIDVEKDIQRGIELITSAAEANLVEAMEKLFVIYSSYSRQSV